MEYTNKLREYKNQIRDTYRTKRRSSDPETRQFRDLSICRRFLGLATYRYADALMLYAPLADEIDIYPIAEDALKCNKIVAFPRCNDNENTMTYYIVTDLAQLKKGAFGIMEPPAELEIFDMERANRLNSVCLIPALVYDRKGFRLGYGKGYYDRYLCNFKKSKVGIIYNDCITDSLPRGKYDTAVDFLVTEKGVITLNAN